MRTSRQLGVFIFLLAMMSGGSARAEWVTLFPYGSSNIRYQFFDVPTDLIPWDTFGPGFDDSDWPVGTAPFGVGSDTLCTYTCPTEWPLSEYTVLLRVWVFVPAGTNYLEIRDHDGNNSKLYINGSGKGSWSGGSDCPYIEKGWGVLPENYYWNDGWNLIVVSSHSRVPWCQWNYLDLEVRADLDPTGLSGESSAPVAFALHVVGANPIRSSNGVNWVCDLPAHALLTVVLHDIAGREVVTPKTVSGGPGGCSGWISAEDTRMLATGVYFITAQAGEFQDTRRILIIR